MGCDTEPGGSCDREEPPQGEKRNHIVIEDSKETTRFSAKYPKCVQIILIRTLIKMFLQYLRMKEMLK